MKKQSTQTNNNPRITMNDDKIDTTRLAYFTEDVCEADDFKPPSCWRVRDATGGRMYFLVRDRKKAQDLCNAYYGYIGGVQKYTVVLDKPAQIR